VRERERDSPHIFCLFVCFVIYSYKSPLFVCHITLSLQRETLKKRKKKRKKRKSMSHGLTVDQDAGQWRQRAPGERVYLFVTEYSKSSRARCRLCSEKIPKDEIRCGTPVAWRGGDFGYINSWSHLKCTRTPDGFVCTKNEIWGLENLSEEDQTLVRFFRLSFDLLFTLEINKYRNTGSC